MANYRFNYRVESFIEADSMEDAVRKFEDIELPNNVDFIEVLSVENGDTLEDLTSEYEDSF